MQNQRKKILFLTGTRADFGKLKPLMMRVEQSEHFECRIFATGMHVLSKYGWTYDEIAKAGFKNIYLYINQMSSDASAMDIILANTVSGLSHYVREFRPDMLVIHGDRVEALAGVIVGALNNILVAHIEGGEISGTIDESVRHAISKLAHLHFVANDEARLRLIQMGESDSKIFTIGSPDIDVMLSDKLPSLEEVRTRYEIPFKKYMIFIYHPVTTEVHKLISKVDNVIKALENSNRNFVVISPNNDMGTSYITEALESLRGNPHFKFYESLRFEYFLTLLKNTVAIVGNSSAGIREAPVYGVPTINIGSRQNNRFNYHSIINVPEDTGEILNALENLPSDIKATLHFGEGKSAELFMKTLESTELWNTNCQKNFQDLMI